jgi:hypothetical protein
MKKMDNIKLKINEIELKEKTCYNCGKKIEIYEDEPLFVAFVDFGASETRITPLVHPEVYILCMDCYNEGKHLNENG